MIAFDESRPSIWMTGDLIAAIKGESGVRREEAEDSVFSEDVRELPYEGFLCGFPKLAPDNLDREILVIEAGRKGMIVEEGRKTTIPSKLLDYRGEVIGEVDFRCEIIGGPVSSGAFMCSSVKNPRTTSSFFGYLFYIIEGDLYAREVRNDQVKDAYRAIKRRWEKTGDSEPLWLEKERFMGGRLPKDGSATRSWSSL